MKNQSILGPIRTKYTGKIFTIKERDVTFSDGEKTIYEYCERPASVSVLAFNKKGELLMQKENRHGYKKNVWFLPGGRMDMPGDTPRKAALRELKEETGYTAKKITLIHTKSPGATLLWDIYVFAARELIAGEKNNERGEYTEPHFIPFKQAVQMALDGTIENEFISYHIIRFDFMRKHKEFSW